jgi:hypothetical protein
MAWDPNQGQGQGQTGNGEQGQPGSGGTDPYSGYGTPQNPYGAPPPQNPYASPPPQNPYGTPPPQYGTPPNQQGGYGYAPPQQAPRPIGQAIQELPNQYIRVLTKPSAQTFAEEMGKADWAMVWIQLLVLAILGTILGFIRAAIGLAGSSFVSNNQFNPAALLALSVSGSTFSFISVPLAFFILVGIQYLLAKAFQGQGRFLTQGYTTLLFQVPIYIASFILGLIPILGGIAGLALLIYSWVLNVFAIMAVHRLSGGKASAVVFIPIIVVGLLLFLCIFAIAAILIAAATRTTP